MTIARKAVALAGQYATEVAVLGRAGIIRPYPPHVLFKMGKTLVQWGTGPAGGFTTLAQRAPHQVGLIDELGELTFLEMHERSNALADSLRKHGVGPGHGVAIMCRNHRGFVDASIAAAPPPRARAPRRTPRRRSAPAATRARPRRRAGAR